MYCSKRQIAAAVGVLIWATCSGEAVADQTLVITGDFESGDVSFQSEYGHGDVWYTGNYGITTDPHNLHVLWKSFGDHTSGAGNMFVANGAMVPDLVAWREVLSVTPSQTYTFGLWAATPYADVGSPAVLQVLVNNEPLGQLTLPWVTGRWVQFEAQWNSGASQTAVLSIVDLNLVDIGNDFALDDIEFVAVPEPATLWLAGLAACLTFRRRR